MKTPHAPSALESAEGEHVRDLLRRIHLGETDLWNDLLRLLGKQLDHLVRGMLRRFPTVQRFAQPEDILQNVLIRLLRTLQKVEPASAADFLALAETNTRRELLELAQQCRKRPRPDETDSSAPLSQLQDAADSADELESWAHFHQQVEKLPILEREIVSLVLYHHWPQGEIARQFQLEARSVRRHLRRALGQLRRAG